MKALVGAFNQEKALVGSFSVIVQPVVEPMDHYTALVLASLIESRCQTLIYAISHSVPLVTDCGWVKYLC